MTATAALVVLLAAVFFSALMQTLSGFGFAILVMPIAVLLLDIRVAAPLVALLAATLNTANVIRYRAHVAWKEVVLLAAAASLGVPVGIVGLSRLPANVMKAGLGTVLVLYGSYILVRPQSVRLRSTRWALLVGFLSGCLGGAYNTSGPPVIIYGTMRQWSREGFRSILQAFFLLVAGQVIVSHYLAHHITRTVQMDYLLLAPVALLGGVLGARVDIFVPQRGFRFLVNILILALGVALLL